METGSISAWNVKTGDRVAAGDVFCSIETDKAVVDFEAQDDGVVAQLLVPAGQEVPVNTPVMVLVADPELVPAFRNFTVDAATTAAPPAATESPAAAVAPADAPSTSLPPSPSATPSTASVFASPLARMLPAEQGLAVEQMSGTGPGGRIIAADVREYQPPAAMTAAAATTVTAATTAPSTAAPPTPGAGYTDYPITNADAAARLAHAKRNVPHYYLTMPVQADALLALRATLNSGNPDHPISVYALLILAAARAMRTVPVVNAAWMDTHVRVYDQVHMNIVTGHAGGDICIPHCTRLTDIEAALQQPPDAADATTTTTMGTCSMVNWGLFGVTSGALILREPQACALSIGALQQKNDRVSFLITATLDHRVVDGAVGAQYLAALKALVEQPSTLLL